MNDLLDTFTDLHRAFEKARQERNALSETLDEGLVTFQTGTYAEHTGLVDAVYMDAPDRRAATRDLLIRAMRKLQKIALVLLGNENQVLEDVGYVVPTHPATPSS